MDATQTYKAPISVLNDIESTTRKTDNWKNRRSRVAYANPLCVVQMYMGSQKWKHENALEYYLEKIQNFIKFWFLE